MTVVNALYLEFDHDTDARESRSTPVCLREMQQEMFVLANLLPDPSTSRFRLGRTEGYLEWDCYREGKSTMAMLLLDWARIEAKTVSDARSTIHQWHHVLRTAGYDIEFMGAAALTSATEQRARYAVSHTGKLIREAQRLHRSSGPEYVVVNMAEAGLAGTQLISVVDLVAGRSGKPSCYYASCFDSLLYG